jgi:hypothetical protein
VLTAFCWENLRERDPGVDERIILNGSSGSGIGEHGLDRSDTGWRQVSGYCKRGNEPSGSTKCGVFLN